MKYDVEGFPEVDFHQAKSLVRATVIASGNAGPWWNSPRRITSDHQSLPKAHRAKVADFLEQPGEIRAVTFLSQNNDMEFDIWFNPELVKPEDPNFRATVIHELCHGYRGVGKGHDQAWRRLYAKSLFHYHHLVHTIEHHIALVDLTNWRYTKRGRTEKTGQFLKRINDDREIWLRQAYEELDQVQELWMKLRPDSKLQKRSQGTWLSSTPTG